MTFSIIARCARTGALGMAVASSSPAVAARCAHLRPGVGVVATQNITDPRLGPRGLDLMQGGLSAGEALGQLCRAAPDIAYRQLALLDHRGDAAVFSGDGRLGVAGAVADREVAVAGNLLAGGGVLPAMLACFAATASSDLGDRLVAAMQAAVEAGGEAGPVRSAGLLLGGTVSWPIADLRIDWQDEPVAALASLWAVWKPQMAAYVTRALTPGEAPAFRVPGDL